MKEIYEIKSVGPINLEAGDETVKPYPVRNIRVKKHGRYEFESFYGTVSDKDALLDLHPGDLISAELSFFACKHRGRWQQEVLFRDVVKLKEVI